MAGIERTRDRDPYGDVQYCVTWEDNHGVGRERFFKSRRAAERHALRIESDLLSEALEDLNATWASLPSEAKKVFNSKFGSGCAKEHSRAPTGIRDGR